MNKLKLVLRYFTLSEGVCVGVVVHAVECFSMDPALFCHPFLACRIVPRIPYVQTR